MSYNAREKFVAPEDSVVVVGSSPTNEEIREARLRIAQGEGTAHVWADIDARVARREQERLGVAE